LNSLTWKLFIASLPSIFLGLGRKLSGIPAQLLDV
jgi:hypothetical protein